MRIAEFHVDGFGRLANLSMTDVPSGLSILLGENEAGKTTLLQFLRSILFGLPARKQKEFYAPQNGGRKGGRIVLRNEESERIIVERFEGKGNGPLTVTMPDGSQGGEADFRQLIGSATDDLYRSVFAFSLFELQTFESLKDEKIRDAIYSAGIGIGRRTITQVLQELKTQADELFSPGASKKTMNQLLSRIEEYGRQMKNHEKDQDTYQHIHAELADCEAALQHLGLELNKARRRSERVRILQQAREDWITLGQSRAQMETLPLIESFPVDGVKRLDELITQRRGFRDQLHQMTSQKQSDEASLAAIQLDKVLLSATKDIRRLDRGRELHEQSRRQFLSFQIDEELAEEKLRSNVRDLGDEWDEITLRDFDFSIPVREEAEECRRACEAASAQVRERRVQAQDGRQELDDACRLQDETRTELSQLPQPSASLDVEGIRKLQLGWEHFDSAQRDLPGIAKQCETKTEHLHDTLRKIGPHWNEDRLKLFDTSLAVQEEVLTYQRHLADVRFDQQEADRRAQETRQVAFDTQADVIRSEEVLAAMPESEVTDESQLSEHRRSLKSLRSLLNAADQRKAHLVHLKERQQDLNAQAGRLRKELERDLFSLPAWVIPILFLVGAVGLLSLGMGRGDWVAGSIVVGLFLIVAVALHFARGVAATRADRQRADRTRECDDLQNRSRELEREAHDVHQELANNHGIFTAQAQQSGFETIPDGLALDSAEGLVDRHLALLHQRRPAEQRREDAQRNLDKAEAAMSRADETATQTANLLAAAQQEWRRWLVKADLPSALTPESAANVLNRLDAAREQLKAIDSERERIRQINQAIREYHQQVKTVAIASGCDKVIPEATEGAMHVLVARLKEHEQHTRAADDAARKRADLDSATARAQRKCDKAQQAYLQAQDAEQKCLQQWKDLLQRLGLRGSLSVETAPQMFQAIERAREQLVLVHDLRRKDNAFQEEIESYCQDVRLVLETLDRPSTCAADIPQTVVTLSAQLADAEETRRVSEKLAEKLQDLETHIKGLQHQINQRQQTIDGLLKAAGTTDEEAFRRNAVEYETRRLLTDQIRQMETRLLHLAGSENALNAMTEELAHATPEDLKSEQKELEELIDSKDLQRTDAVDKRGRLKVQLEQLENSDELSRLRIAQQADRAEFETGAEEWSVLRIAAHLIDRAREKYERERRPGVLKEAERYFARFTNRNYTEIIAPPGGHQVVVLSPDGSRKDIGQLSRGTAEQLYLSLRFGFVRAFVGRSEPLPLVFDDILVNFDPARARATIEAILDLSESLQILLFTCHPSTVALIKEVESSIPVFALNHGRFITAAS